MKKNIIFKILFYSYLTTILGVILFSGAELISAGVDTNTIIFTIIMSVIFTPVFPITSLFIIPLKSLIIYFIAGILLFSSYKFFKKHFLFISVSVITLAMWILLYFSSVMFSGV